MPPPTQASTVAPSSQPKTKARPTGITILVLLEAIGSALLLASGVFLLAFAGRAREFFPGHPFMAGVVLVGVGALSLLLGIVGLLICWGLWTAQGWAWTVALALAVLGAILGLVQLPGGILTLILNGLIVYYLWQPHVKAFYGKQRVELPYQITITKAPPARERLYCPNCWASNPSDARFCSQCGSPLKAPEAPGP